MWRWTSTRRLGKHSSIDTRQNFDSRCPPRCEDQHLCSADSLQRDERTARQVAGSQSFNGITCRWGGSVLASMMCARLDRSDYSLDDRGCRGERRHSRTFHMRVYRKKSSGGTYRANENASLTALQQPGGLLCACFWGGWATHTVPGSGNFGWRPARRSHGSRPPVWQDLLRHHSHGAVSGEHMGGAAFSVWWWFGRRRC